MRAYKSDGEPCQDGDPVALLVSDYGNVLVSSVASAPIFRYTLKPFFVLWGGTNDIQFHPPVSIMRRKIRLYLHSL